MGISGKKEKLFCVESAKKRSIPIIKRFSGGGAVVVDENTLFVSFILNQEMLEASFKHPFNHQGVMQWSKDFYANVFQDKSFDLLENDYVFADKKFGGNAQYFQKNRGVHHTSFLWDYKNENMQLLLMPERRPEYRQERRHQDFLICLKEKYQSLQKLEKKILKTLKGFFELEKIEEEELQKISKRPHRKSTKKDPP